MNVVLTKNPDCVGAVNTTFEVTEPTRFTFLSKGENQDAATIHFDGALVAQLSHSNPIYDTQVLGEYALRISGSCNESIIKSHPVVLSTATDNTLAGHNQLLITCKADDVNDDLTEIVTYYEACLVTIDEEGNLATQSIGTFEDELLKTPYVVSSEIDINSIPDAVQSHNREVLQGASWSPTALTKIYTVNVYTVDNPLTPPTFTDGRGIQTDLCQGEIFTYDIGCEDIGTLPIISTGVDDKVIVTWIECEEPAPVG